MAFKAGAIKSTMELNRTPFRQGLRAARQELRRFGQERAVARVDINTARAHERVRRLRGELRNLGALSRHVDVTANTGAAAAQLRALSDQARRFAGAGTSAQVGVDTGASAAQLRALQAQVISLQSRLAALDRTRSNPSVRMGGLRQALTQVQWLQVALVGLGPAAVPVIAALAAQTIALAGALSMAGAAAGVLGLAVGGQVVQLVQLASQLDEVEKALADAVPGTERYNELLAQQKELLASMSPAQRAVLDQWEALGSTVRTFGDPAQEQILAGILNMLVGAQAALVALQPAVVPLANTFLLLTERFREWAEGPAMAAFGRWVAETGPTAILWLVNTLINLGATLGNLMVAFMPLTGEMVKAEGSFARLREWSAGLAVNPQFQEFLAYVQQNGPLVWATLGSLANALIQVGWALAPLAPPILMAVGALADMVAQVAVSHPWLIQLAWAALLVSRVWGPMAAGATLVKTALQSQAAAWLLAKTRMLAYNVTMRVIRAATAAWTVAQWALNVAMNANPIGLIVLAVAAFIAYMALIVLAIKYAWENFDWFRNGVLAVWEAIKTGALWLWTNGIKPVVDWIVDAFRNYVAPAALWLWTNGIQPVLQWIVNAFNNYVLPAITFFVGMWKFYFGIIWTVLKTVWSFIWPVLQFIGLVAFAIIATALGVLWSYWKFVFNAIATVVKWLWTNAVKPVVDWIVNAWNKYLVPALKWLHSQWKRLMEAIGAANRWLWTNVVNPVLTWIVDKFVWLYTRYLYYKTLIQAVFTAMGLGIGIMRDRFRAAIDKVVEFGQNLLRSWRGVRDSVKEIFRQLANHARRPINWVIDTVYNNGVRKVSRNVLSAVGMQSLADKIPRAATIPAFRSGGPVDPDGYTRGPGSGTSDEILARVANREFVVNAKSTARWRPILEWINGQGRRVSARRSLSAGEAGLPSFARGGLVDPFALASTAFLGGSRAVLKEALDALGFDGWIKDMKAGPPIWKGAAGGAMAMAANGILDFLSKKDETGGGGGVVAQAKKHVGKRGNPNEFTRAFGMDGLAWCAMFVSEMIRHAKAEKLYHNVRSAAVASFANSSMKSVGVGQAAPGDLAVYRGRGPGNWGHINIVEDPRKRTSIGGNESNAVRRQTGYYSRAAKLMRPGLAGGGLVGAEYLRQVLGQDYGPNSAATTPLDLAFWRVLAGLPAYQGGGTADEGPALLGEDGPELVNFGARARVRSAPDTAEILAEAIVRAWRKMGLTPGEMGERAAAQVTVNGLATTEVIEQIIRRLRAEEALAAASAGSGMAPRPGEGG